MTPWALATMALGPWKSLPHTNPSLAKSWARVAGGEDGVVGGGPCPRVDGEHVAGGEASHVDVAGEALRRPQRATGPPNGIWLRAPWAASTATMAPVVVSVIQRGATSTAAGMTSWSSRSQAQAPRRGGAVGLEAGHGAGLRIDLHHGEPTATSCPRPNPRRSGPRPRPR